MQALKSAENDEWEGQRRMSQGHVQCVYVCMNEGGGGVMVWTCGQGDSVW